MRRLRRFEAHLSYRNAGGVECEESFPLRMDSFDAAQKLALRYVLQILKLQDFEIRMLGS